MRHLLLKKNKHYIIVFGPIFNTDAQMHKTSDEVQRYKEVIAGGDYRCLRGPVEAEKNKGRAIPELKVF